MERPVAAVRASAKWLADRDAAAAGRQPRRGRGGGVGDLGGRWRRKVVEGEAPCARGVESASVLSGAPFATRSWPRGCAPSRLRRRRAARASA